MSIRFLLYGCVVLLLGCSSDSHIANSSTNTLKKLSPVGSRQVTRDQQMAISSHYRIRVAYAAGGLRSDDIDDLNLLARDALARHMKRYFAHITVADKAASLEQSLNLAASSGDQLMMYARIENWPNIEPIRIRECTTEEGDVKTSLGECEDKGQAQSDELVVMVAIYDVLSRQQVDSIYASSRRGVASYLYEDSVRELEELNQLILLRLAPNSGLR